MTGGGFTASTGAVTGPAGATSAEAEAGAWCVAGVDVEGNGFPPCSGWLIGVLIENWLSPGFGIYSVNKLPRNSEVYLL